MREELELKLDNLKKLLDEDERIIELIDKKNKLVNNREFMARFEKLKNLDIYSSEYKELKKELFNEEDFASFKELENEINYLILEINKKLKTLTNERRCSNENN